MSFLPKRIEHGKHCFVYCGVERCNCSIAENRLERINLQHISKIKDLDAPVTDTELLISLYKKP